MAPSVADTSVATAALDEAVSKPPAGVVLPPKDIRTIVEKTAGFVARNGPTFEDRVRQKEGANPKFSFLAENDAYSAYYLWRLGEVREGRGTAVSAGRVGEDAARPAPEKPKGPERPPDFHFSARMPNINALDLEVVKLTALFVAKNGRSFATTLSQRESTKSQFDFLRPQHSLYQFFTRLVDQYKELLEGGLVDGGKPEQLRIQELDLNVKNKFHILGRAKKRAEWVRFQEAQKAKKEEEAEAERISYAQIDWHDFVVVETVVFTETDDLIDLPPPTSLAELQSASLEQRANMSLAPSNMRIEEAFPTEDMNMYSAPPPPPVVHYPPPMAAHIPLPTLPPPPKPIPVAQPPPVRIVESGTVPRAMARRRNVTTALCPNCKQQIPMDELEQHMKVELLDPEWRKQRAIAESRSATTNLSTADVANNLKRLASQRTDVFDPVANQREAEEPKAKKPATGTHGMSINDQIRSIHERYGQ
jgi:splicing factor 3A subunit 1